MESIGVAVGQQAGDLFDRHVAIAQVSQRERFSRVGQNALKRYALCL